MAEALKEQMRTARHGRSCLRGTLRHARRCPVPLPGEQEDEAAFEECEAESVRLHGGHRLPGAPGSRQVGDAEASGPASGYGNTRTSSSSGPTGTGKTYLACALAHRGLPGRNERLLPAHARRSIIPSPWRRADGSYARVLARLGRMSLLILDDLGLAALTDPERRDLLEVIEDRHGSASTIITSQLPVEHWHEVIGDPTIADALLDRLVHNAHRISLKGESRPGKTGQWYKW